MSKPVLAAQLYTVRRIHPDRRELGGLVTKVKEIGYAAVQVSAIGPIPDVEVKGDGG